MTNTHDEQKPLSEGMLQAMEDARTGRGYSMKEPINTTDEWLWTDWTGGDCPIPDAKAGEYDLQFTDGEPSNVVNKVDASAWNWRNAEVMIPIVAYRVRLPAEDLLRQARMDTPFQFTLRPCFQCLSRNRRNANYDD